MDFYSSHHYHNDYHNRSRWFAIAAVASLVGFSAYWFHGLVSLYGWEGAVNYIWEGDPYPNLRERLDKLKAVARKIAKPEKLLNSFETALERANLDSIQEADASSVVQQWQANLPASIDLRTRLGILSSDLDKLAAQVDGVVSEGSTVLKDRKKDLSKRLVRFMERTDKLIAFYKQGRAPTSGTTTASTQQQ